MATDRPWVGESFRHFYITARNDALGANATETEGPLIVAPVPRIVPDDGGPTLLPFRIYTYVTDRGLRVPTADRGTVGKSDATWIPVT